MYLMKDYPILFPFRKRKQRAKSDLNLQCVIFKKQSKDKDYEIIVPSCGYDDDNHIWLNENEIKQIVKFYKNV